jgi:hypothetical protein
VSAGSWSYKNKEHVAPGETGMAIRAWEQAEASYARTDLQADRDWIRLWLTPDCFHSVRAVIYASTGRCILRPAAISSLRFVGGCASRSETNSTRHRIPGSCLASRSAISPTRLSVSSDAGPGAASRPMTSSGCD